MMKVLVTGANGMLGSALCPALRRQNYEVYPTDIDTTNASVKYLDITNKQQADKFVQTRLPDLIFHLAALTDVDKCEKKPQYANSVNVEGTRNIAEICQKRNLVMVYISTAEIFDGYKKQPYVESDEPNPINTYARTKWEGEEIVSGLLSRYFIVRTGWMFGGQDKDKKFVGKIVKLLRGQKQIEVVNDKFGSPTFTEDLSECMMELIKTQMYGLYHITNQGWCSRYEIACKIAEFLNANHVAIKPVSSGAFSLDARRGNSEAMDNSKLKSLGIQIRPWEEALKEYITRFEDLKHNEKEA